MGPSGKVRHYFYLFILQFYYLIMSVARLAHNFLPLVFAYLFAGDNCNFTRLVGVVDDISLEALAWIVWLCSICFLQSLYWIIILVCFCGCIFTYFCEWEPPDDNRRTRRTVRKEFISKGRMPMMAVDQRYMILSGFVLHRYISFMFSSTIKWEVYVRGLQSHFHFLTWSTYRTFRDNLPAWPPDGYIMAVVVFFGLILFHVVVLVTSVLQIASFRFRKLFLRLHRFFYKYPISSALPSHEKLPMHHIYASIFLSTDDMETITNRAKFDTDSTTAIVDNSANAHIWTI